MRAFALVPALLPFLSLACLPAQGGDATPPAVSTPLGDELPVLAEHSVWAQDARYEGEQPDKSKRGVYPVGNGKVFGYLGLGARANTMQGVSGPTYQTEDVFAPQGHFGAHTLELLVDGKVVELPEQHVRRVRGANFVVTVDEHAAGASLRTLSFAPPDGTAIVRVVEVVNLGGQELRGAALRLRVDAAADRPDPPLLRVDYDRGGRRCHAVLHLTENTPDGVALPPLAPQARWRGVLTIATAPGAAAATRREQYAPREDAVNAAVRQASATHAWWQQKLKDTTYLDTDHKKLRDLFHDWKVLMLVQRDAQSGAVSPMVNYRGCWVRDSVGPLLAFLRFNMWQEAKDILVYLHNATRLHERVPNHVPLDLDFAALAGKKVDWDRVEVPPSEVPSWIVLMHFWYWRVTRDHELIRAHKQMLDRCVRGQRRTDQVLMPFHGDETWLHGAFYSLWPERVADGRFIADDQWQGRSTFSFPAAVQYLLAIQAIGEMENGLDEAAHPEKYAAEVPPGQRPGQRWLTTSIHFMQALEQAFWIDDLGMFAPALSPVTRQPHRQPYADANLMPLWLGWTFPSGEKSRDNLKHTLQRLWLRDGRLGQTATTGHACGHTQAKLVTALTERDAKDRLDTVDALLRMAEPAGEWGELYDDNGRPVAAYDKDWPNRCRPWESGINLDALLFAISGIRFVATPNFDARDIRAKLRLPHGATYVSMRHVRKDGRDLDLYWRETFEKMSEADRKVNEEKAPEKRLDPEATHRRVRFRVGLNSANPRQGYYDVGLNAACTLFVRYLTHETPIDEFEYWADDSNEFLPAHAPAATPPRYEITVPASAKTLYLSNRALAGELVGGDATVCLVDTGLPATPQDFASALLDADGKRRVDTLFFDWRAEATGRTTFKLPSFWSDPAWVEAQRAFVAAGGKVLRARFLAALDVEGGGQTAADADGRIALRLTDGKEAVATATITAAAAQEAVLRVGTNTGVQVEVNGESVLEHQFKQDTPRQGRRHPLPDLDAALVRLRAGSNTLRLRLQGREETIVYARITDARGLPIDGVE